MILKTFQPKTPQLWVRTVDPVKPFFQQSVSILFILEEINLTSFGTSTTVRLLVTGLLDVTSIGLRTLFIIC